MFVLVIGLAEMAQAVPLKLTSSNPVFAIPLDKSLCNACNKQEKAGDNEVHTRRPAPLHSCIASMYLLI